MSIHTIDLLFPFFVFGYGVLVSFVLNVPALVDLAENRFPAPMVEQLKAHRWLGIICLIVGSIWSLQTIWLN